jgi:hypothetical protein
MDSIKRDARLAGALYVPFTLVGFFALEYVPSKLFVSGDATATAHNIVTNETMFRLMMGGELLGGLLALIVALILYRLFAGVDQTQAILLLILGGMTTPLYFVNVVNYAGALMLAQGAPFLTAFSEVQRDALMMVLLRLHHYELVASFVFAGLWLFPFGALVYKSRFLPRILGIWLIVNGFAYLAVAIAGFLAPQYSDTVSTVVSPILLGEVVMMLWLLIVGARPKAA